MALGENLMKNQRGKKMKNLKIKKVVILVLSAITISAASIFGVAAADKYDGKYAEQHLTYTLKDGWEDTVPLANYDAMGLLHCRYTNGILSAPKTETSVSGGSNISQSAVVSYIIVKDGTKYEERDEFGITSAEVVVKAGFFESPTKTWHYGHVNDLINVALAEYTGS